MRHQTSLKMLVGGAERREDPPERNHRHVRRCRERDDDLPGNAGELVVAFNNGSSKLDEDFN